MMAETRASEIPNVEEEEEGSDLGDLVIFLVLAGVIILVVLVLLWYFGWAERMLRIRD